MASVNKVIVLGNLGNDPETRYTQDGSAITTISVATSRQYKNAAGEKQEETEWHRIVFFGRQAEIAAQYLKKGRPVYVEGRLKTHKWQDKNTGADRYATEIVAESLQLLGSRDEGAQPAPAPQRQAEPQRSSRPATSVADMDNDIPF